MNDAERDAWLREALRHAPDAGALPPEVISEAILAEARANAHSQAVPPRAGRAARASPRHPLAAFWDWLARPPVAASFASVMAATLVGLMWWDRPMDETLPRRPEVTIEPAAKTAPGDGALLAQRRAPPADNEPAIGGAAGNTAAPATTPRAADAGAAIAPAPQPRRQLPAEQDAATRDARIAPRPADEKRKVEDAAAAKENAERSARKVARPAPFPAAEEERTAAPAAPALEKKDTADRLARSVEGVPPAGAAAQPPAAAAPAPVAAPQPAPARSPESTLMRAAPATTTTAPAGRRADQDQASPSTANSGAIDAAKSTPALPATTMAAPRSGALADMREKQASAFASAPPAPAATRNEIAAQTESRSATATPLAAVLASIASEPAQWSRSSASGSVVALDSGWRDWLAQLDAAANGRWRRVGGDSGAATSGGRDGATTLRLVLAGRPAGVVSLDGTTVRIDGVAPGERWQAILPSPAAEQLRAAADRLAR